MELIGWAELQEKLLKVQLSVIRCHIRAARLGEKERGSPHPERKSQMDMITDILAAAGKPLHVFEIIRIVEERYRVRLDRESIVSALAKKVNKGVKFVGTAPNTFALKGE